MYWSGRKGVGGNEVQAHKQCYELWDGGKVLKKSFLLGIICVFISALSGLFLRDWSITMEICGYIGLGCLLLAGIFQGSYLSGGSIRGNYANESKEDRDQREGIAGFLFIISVPNCLVAGLFLYFLGL